MSAQCGHVYHGTDVVLAADLACAAGLEIDEATLDLQGHTLSGEGSGVGVTLGPHATLENGTIRGYANGVLIAGAFGTVTRTNVVDNVGTGIQLLPDEADDATVSFSQIAHNGGAGIDAEGQSDAGLFEANSVVENNGNGITIDDSTATVLHNDTSHNGGTGISLFEGESPIYAPAYLIGGNEADHNRGAGIAVCVRLAAAGGCAGGMRDLGGNIALGNAPQRDCVNIRCRRASRAILS